MSGMVANEAASVTHQVLVALRRIVRAIDLHSRFLATRFGLTGPQLTVLRELSHRGGVSISDLAKAVHLSHATVTDILARLQRRGLVQRVRSEADKRRVLAWATPAAEETLSRTPPLLQEHFLAQFSKLEEWEQTQILFCLQRLASMMDAKPLDAIPGLPADRFDAVADQTTPLDRTTPLIGPGAAPVTVADQQRSALRRAREAPNDD
ncbi:MAG: MarR family winged helix-turn-helix transcriptional regulator [Acidobacteriota bacterium]